MKFKMTPDKLMIALFAIVLLVIPITTLALPKSDRSENENRTLAKFPSLVNQTKLNKAQTLDEVIQAIKWNYITERGGASYMDDFETYFSDHLAGRELWVKASNRMSTAVGKDEINGVYTVDGRMMESFRGYDENEVQRSIDAVNAFAEKYPDIPMYFMLAPTSLEIYKSRLPSYSGVTSEKAFMDECYEKLVNVNCVNALSYLSGRADEYIYYRTDHHWTSLGAYYAYTALARPLGFTAISLNSFNIETASSSFRGTLYSKTLDDSIEPDTIEYYFLADGEPKVTLTRINGDEVETFDSLYVREYLETKDKYSSFTGSNVPIVTIETDADSGRELLIIKDSYAHSLVPFLSKHFSKITMVDLRYINTDLNRFITVSDYDSILFAYNVIGFCSESYLKKLALTS
ncbi:MAG: hypothetical protein J1F04_08835 [Oscillospiraceae bacterium]|nr:hypothetical protein [Oscillospiraceae bacterium]